ncbi:MAG TPA: hypothetical protein VGL77_08550 [Armatimonadota bacterium]
MAQALRTVLLEPEEPQENIAITLTPRHERKAAPDLLQRPGRLMLCLAGALALLMLYIGGNAQIARYEYERQALQQEYAQLNRDCVRLTMARDRMASQPKVTAVAQSIGLEVPTADRIHYVTVTGPLPSAVVAQAPVRQSWVAQTGTRLVAALDSTLQRLSRGPGEPAYAHE